MQDEYLKKFSINDVRMYGEKGEDLDFSIVEIWALAEGNNSHRNPFSVEVLERDADTFKGKFIVAKFDKWTKDTQGHELDEVIVGYIDPNEKIEFKTKVVEGAEKEFVVVKGLLSKIYAEDIIQMFRDSNSRTVSCEFSCSTQYDENEYGRPVDEQGKELNIDNPILRYHIHGITILGLKYNPSVRGTEIKVKEFASLNDKESSQQGDEVSNKDKEETMEENKNLSESVDKEQDVVMEEAEEKELAEKECAETESEPNATEEKLSEEESNEEEKTDDQKELAEIESDDKDDDNDSDDDKEDDKDKDDSDDVAEESKEYEEVEVVKTESELELGCLEEEKAFSLDAYADVSATLALLQNETESNKELADQVLKSMSAVEILKTVLTLSTQNAELTSELEGLKAFKEEREALDKQIRLSSIMGAVKEDLSTKDFEELQTEGKALSLSELDAFENKVKAYAYEATKAKRESFDGVMTFAGISISNGVEALTADAIYKKYL